MSSLGFRFGSQGLFLPSRGIVPVLDMDLTAILDSRITFTRSSSATYRNSTGAMALAATNAARFDHSSGGTALGLLIEDTRQNKCNNYNYNPTATTNMTKGGHAAATLTVVNDAAELAAAKLDGICTNGNVYKLDNSAGTSNATVTFGDYTGNTNPHTMSVYWRGSGTAYFGLNTNSGSSTSLPSSYVRKVTANITPTSAFNVAYLIVQAGGVCYFILNQMEESSFATSVVLTAGAKATRSPDLATMTGTNFSSWFNQAEGAFIAEFDSPADGNRTAIQADDDSQNNRHTMRAQGTTSAYVILAGGVSQASGTQGTITANVSGKMALAYKANDFAACWNGGTVSTDTSGSVPTVDRLRIGRNAVPTEFLNGHISRLKYYDRYLAAPALQAA